MKLLPILFFLMLYFTGFCQDSTLILSGINHAGKSIYIQNDWLENDACCILKVVVNDSIVLSDTKSPAVEVPLNYIALSDSVHLKIIHKYNCLPRILNPQILSKNLYKRIYLDVGKNSIRWIRRNSEGGVFYLENFTENRWKAIVEVEAGQDSVFEMAVKHENGLNKYRIKFKDKNGQLFYSDMEQFNFETHPEVQLYLKGHCFYFGKEEKFVIKDGEGFIFKEGRDDHVCLTDIGSGVYYITVRNQTRKYFKK